MKNKQKFFETTIVIKVLSDKSLSGYSLSEIIEESDTGEFVLKVEKQTDKKMSSKLTASRLYDYGSSPSFFNLDENGNEEF